MQTDALIAYLEAHPLLAVGLAALVLMVLGSLLKKLLKIAFVLALIFLAGLYWTHREAASGEWQARLDLLKAKAGEYGQKALEKAREKGTEALEKAGRKIEEELRENE